MPELNHELLTPEEAAEFLSVKLSTIYAWVHQRKIPYLKLGRCLRFSPTVLQRWLEELAVEPHPIHSSDE